MGDATTVSACAPASTWWRWSCSCRVAPGRVLKGWWWDVRPVIRLSLVIVWLATGAGRAHAALLFPSVVDRVTGVRMEVAPVRASFTGEQASMRVEAADAELYGVAGLRSAGLRAAASARRMIVAVSVVNVSSPVGVYARAVAETGVKLNTWQGALRGGFERLSLDAEPALTWRVAGLVSRVDVSRVSALADFEVREGNGAYETTMTLATWVRAGSTQLVGNVRIDGDRFVGAGVAIVARLHRNVALLAGYDDGAESMRAGAVVDWRGMEIATGVFQHPVLGMSQAVSVACFH
jgi:hypothetical protein